MNRRRRYGGQCSCSGTLMIAGVNRMGGRGSRGRDDKPGDRRRVRHRPPTLINLGFRWVDRRRRQSQRGRWMSYRKQGTSRMEACPSVYRRLQGERA